MEQNKSTTEQIPTALESLNKFKELLRELEREIKTVLSAMGKGKPFEQALRYIYEGENGYTGLKIANDIIHSDEALCKIFNISDIYNLRNQTSDDFFENFFKKFFLKELDRISALKLYSEFPRLDDFDKRDLAEDMKKEGLEPAQVKIWYSKMKNYLISQHKIYLEDRSSEDNELELGKTKFDSNIYNESQFANINRIGNNEYAGLPNAIRGGVIFDQLEKLGFTKEMARLEKSQWLHSSKIIFQTPFLFSPRSRAFPK